MNSVKPYLIRAFYDWIIDNECTPHIVVNALADGVQVPKEYVQNGQIVLNIAMNAVKDLNLDDDNTIAFNARFGGVPRAISVPISAVMHIYARENGRGMMFPEEEYNDDNPPPEKTSTSAGGQGKGKSGKGGRAHLTIVK